MWVFSVKKSSVPLSLPPPVSSVRDLSSHYLCSIRRTDVVFKKIVAVIGTGVSTSSKQL